MSSSKSQEIGSDHPPSYEDRQAHDEELEEFMRQEFANLGIQPEPDDTHGGRRKLLLIYIHGFLGSEESFRAFPAHVHSLLSILIQETHVVHSKIYPRYRSRRYIQAARDDFSRWLQPHESPTTDIILLGHSMGGLVSGEVVLMPATRTGDSFLHRILGTLNFDVPFIGMHPGVVKSGLASIFAPPDDPEDKYASRSIADHAMAQLADGQPGNDRVLDSDDSSFWDSQDGNFNAAYSNDVVLPVRRFWSSVAHFLHKHGQDVINATGQMVNSHIEFMSAMGNIKQLRERYAKLRMLEEDSEAVRRSAVQNKQLPPRVRFTNYYTVSTGRPPRSSEQPSSPSNETDDAVPAEKTEQSDAEHSVKQELESQPESASLTDGTPSDPLVKLPPFGSVASVSQSKSTASGTSSSKPPKRAKEGTFCTLPPKDSHGQRDPCWVRMFMEDVDEVGAHCGMFFVDERYERFVGDTAQRIEGWVKNDLSVRTATQIA